VNAVVRAEIPRERLTQEDLRAIEDGSARRWALQPTGDGEGAGAIPVEVSMPRMGTEGADSDSKEGTGSSSVQLVFVVPGALDSGASREFELVRVPERTGAGADESEVSTPWELRMRGDGSLELKNRERTVFRYNVAPTHHPNYDRVYDRSAYIHPAFTPAGSLVTGDYSRAHPHHRGFFLSYARVRVDGELRDFWNIQGRKGKIRCLGIGGERTGPVTASFWADHGWSLPDDTVVLRERWVVTAYDIPERPYWLFEIASTQEAVGRPFELVPYRYGGMAYRGPDSFLPLGKLDVLTSEGLDRMRGDQKPARWVDLTGPTFEDPKAYAGAMVAEHASNPGYPNVARIHPTTLPFFTFVPAHQSNPTPVVFEPGKPVVFRFRVVIHDGHPDGALDELVAQDFVTPCEVQCVPAD
jgi:hypothetical protein